MYSLGLSRSDFWQSTPRQFTALRLMAQQRQDQEFFRTGILATILLKANGVKNVSPTDFIPGYVPPPVEAEVLEAKWMALFGQGLVAADG